MLPEPLFLNVHMYGIMIAVGLLFAFWVVDFYGKKLRMSEKFIDFVFYTSIVAIIFGFFGASVFQSLYDYIENPEAGFKFGSDITFLGGIISGTALFLIVYFVVRKKYDDKLIDMLSVFPCAITVAHAFGRIGCFFAGCCYGKETDFFLAVKFPKLPYPVHPTQLYEAAFLFLIFGVFSYLVLKKKDRYVMCYYLVSYGVFRFMIEYLRDDHRGSLVAGMSPSQFWSVLMVVGGIILYFLLKKYFKNRVEPVSVLADDSDVQDDGIQSQE